MGLFYGVSGAIVLALGLAKGAMRVWIWLLERKISKLEDQKAVNSYRERGY